MKFLATVADHKASHSWSAKLRRQRFQLLEQLLAKHPGEVQILDLGGTAEYWNTVLPHRSQRLQITLLNIDEPECVVPGFQYLQGDARDLSQFADQSFDLIVSNSVIEHVGDWTDQQQMAGEIQRVARSYYVQTPNRYFPIEPHFLFPGYQFLPEWAQLWLLQNMRLGTYDKVADRTEALALIREIRLLSLSEYRQLFPVAKIHVERFCGLKKSFIAVKSPS
jgi:hypothetical protein